MIRQRMADGFERCLFFIAAYDHRADGRGQHGVDLYAALVGPEGAVNVRVFTGWDWALGQQQLHDRRPLLPPPVSAMGAGIAFHLPAAAGDAESRPCEFLGTCKDGASSFLSGDRVFGRLITEGDEGLWAALREAYDAMRPQPEEDDER